MSIEHRLAHLAFASLLLAASLCVIPSSAVAGEFCPFFVGGDDTYGIVSGDFNGDGLDDVAITSHPAILPYLDVPKLSVFLGDTGPGPVHPGGVILIGDFLEALAVGDMNEDGALDLIAAGGNGVPYSRLMPGDGNGGFALGETFPLAGASDLAVGDFNGDSHLDLVAGKGSAGVSVFFGDGQGHLGPEQSVSSIQVSEVMAGDLNEDGRADIVAIQFALPLPPSPLLVFLGNADGTFTALPAPPTGPMYAAKLGDMNEDGHLDVVAGRSPYTSPNVRTFLGRGDGTFETDSAPVAQGGLFVVAIGDVDGDGHLDALSYNPDATLTFCAPNTPLFFQHGRGDGTLADGVATVWRSNHTVMALGDTNGDGFLDAALPSCGSLVVRPGEPDGLGDVVNNARAFTAKNGGDVIKLNSNKAAWCAQVEGINGSLDVTQEGLIDVALVSEGTGSVSSVLTNSKERVVVDSDNNGVIDREFCFPKDQLRMLFSSITETRTVNVTIEGTLGLDGCRFRAPLTVTVIPAGGSHAAAAMNPNVFASSSVLSFQTPRGQVRARVYDVSGRLVKTLMDGSAEGAQRVRVEARDTSGKPLPSGVYFFRIESPSGLETGRFVIAR
jgi:hypothetical protein